MGSFFQEMQSRGRALRLVENPLDRVPMTQDVFEILKKKYEGSNNFVKTDVHGNIIHPYTLH